MTAQFTLTTDDLKGLASMVLRKYGDPNLAEDAAQIGATKAWETFDASRGVKLFSWATRLTLQAAAKLYHAERRARTTLLPEQDVIADPKQTIVPEQMDANLATAMLPTMQKLEKVARTRGNSAHKLMARRAIQTGKFLLAKAERDDLDCYVTRKRNQKPRARLQVDLARELGVSAETAKTALELLQDAMQPC